MGIEPLTELPDAPAWLKDSVARVHFAEIGGTCVGMGVLTTADIPALSMLAQTFADWHWAVAELREGVSQRRLRRVGSKRHPAALDSLQFGRSYWAQLCEFGLTPASRPSVERIAPRGETKSDRFFGSG